MDIYHEISELHRKLDLLIELQTAEKSDRKLNVDEAATYLGISKSLLYKLTHGKKLTYYKPAKKIYFFESELDEYVKTGRVSTLEEIDKKSTLKLLRRKG